MTQSATSWNSYPAFAAHLAWTDAAGNQNQLTFDCVVSEQWDEDATVTEHPVEQGADVTDHVRVELRKCELKVWATNEPIDANNWDEATITSSTLSLDPNGVQPRWKVGSGELTVSGWDNPILLRSLAGSLVGLAGSAIGSAVGGSATGMIAGDVAALAGLEAAFLLDPAEATAGTVQTDAGLEPNVNGLAKVQTQQWPDSSSGGTDYVAKTIGQLQLLKNTAQQIDLLGSKQSCSPMVIEKFSTVRSAETGTGADITIGLREVRIVTTQTVPVSIPNLSGGGGVPPKNKGSQDPQDAPVQTQKSVAKQLKAAGVSASSIASFLGAGA